MSQAAMHNRPLPDHRAAAPAAADQSSYISQAEQSLAKATAAPDPAARALHQEECQLWLMLARQRRAIEDVVQRLVVEDLAA